LTKPGAIPRQQRRLHFKFESAFVEKVAVANVYLTIANIKHRSEILREMQDNNEIVIVGGLYKIETGSIEFYQ